MHCATFLTRAVRPGASSYDTMNRHLLDVEQLRVGFAIKGRTLEIIRGISFHLGHQEAIGLVGESGSGKSLTASAIIQLVSFPGRILGGRIHFEGKDLVPLPRKEVNRIRGAEISMVFQDPSTSLNPVFSIGTQLMDVIRAHQGVGRDAAVEIAVGILESVGIAHAKARLRSYPHELSGGMRQRIIIGMAVACRPKLLILDEPTSALDVTVQAQVVKLIRRLQDEQGFSILLITHNLDLAADICDRVIVMYAGEIVEDAPVQSLFAAPRHPYTRALLDCVPRLATVARGFDSIPGQPPAAGARIVGCAFAERCSLAFERCRHERPQPRQVDRYHRAACLLSANNLVVAGDAAGA